MVIVNTTFAVSPVHDADFRRWARHELTPLWNTEACQGELLRVVNNAPDADAISYALQMRFKSMTEAVSWQNAKFAAGIELCFKKFEGKVMPFCTVLESV